MKTITLFKPYIAICITFYVLLFACQEDDSFVNNNNNQGEDVPNTFSEYFGNEVNRDFLGSVVDTNGNPYQA